MYHHDTMQTRSSLIDLLLTMGHQEDAAQLVAAQSEQRAHEKERKAQPDE
jgi:hypothetical protein